MVCGDLNPTKPLCRGLHEAFRKVGAFSGQGPSYYGSVSVRPFSGMLHAFTVQLKGTSSLVCRGLVAFAMDHPSFPK